MQGIIGTNLFDVKFPASKAGLSTVGYTLLNADGTEYTARTVTSVIDQGYGAYNVEVVFASPWMGMIIWDTGDVDIKRATEGINIVAGASVDVNAVATAVDVLLSTNHGSGSWGSDAVVSPVPVKFTVEYGEKLLDGVAVYVTTDVEGLSVVAGPFVTDAFGNVTFLLDPGTYYVWKQLSGYNFTNPETVTVTV